MVALKISNQLLHFNHLIKGADSSIVHNKANQQINCSYIYYMSNNRDDLHPAIKSFIYVNIYLEYNNR